MSDDSRDSTGTSIDDEEEYGEEVSEEDYEKGEFEELEATLAEEPTFEDEEGTTYDPATQAPKEAGR